MDSQEAQLEYNVDKFQHYADNLFAALERPHLTAAKRTTLERNLAIDLDGLARNQRALDAYRASYHEPPVEAVAIGPDPIANLGEVDLTQLYECLPDFDPEAFEDKYGYSIQTALDRVVTGLLRPNLNQIQALVASSGGTFDQRNADYLKNGLVTKQKSVLSWFKGEASFASAVAPYLGSWADYLGCINIAAISDLGSTV